MFYACQRYGKDATRPLFENGEGRGGCGGVGGGEGGSGGRGVAGGRAEAGDERGGLSIIPALVNFVRFELEDWERRRYSQVPWVRAGGWVVVICKKGLRGGRGCTMNYEQRRFVLSCLVFVS